jgi:hypothetical protein
MTSERRSKIPLAGRCGKIGKPEGFQIKDIKNDRNP